MSFCNSFQGLPKKFYYVNPEFLSRLVKASQQNYEFIQQIEMLKQPIQPSYSDIDEFLERQRCLSTFVRNISPPPQPRLEEKIKKKKINKINKYAITNNDLVEDISDTEYETIDKPKFIKPIVKRKNNFIMCYYGCKCTNPSCIYAHTPDELVLCPYGWRCNNFMCSYMIHQQSEIVELNRYNASECARGLCRDFYYKSKCKFTRCNKLHFKRFKPLKR